MPPRMHLPIKVCAACGLPMHRKWYGTEMMILEQPTRYLKRKYCDNTCKAIGYRKPQKKVRECKQCGTPIHRKRWPSGKMETTKVLRSRRFCDAECAFLYADDRGLKWRFLNRWRHEQNRLAAMR